MSSFHIVAAINTDSLIGILEYGEYSIPWPLLKHDMEHFKNLTTSAPLGEINAIIVGRKTWDTLGPIYKANQSRINIVITSDPANKKSTHGEKYVSSFQESLDLVNDLIGIHQVFVIGGGSIYQQAIQHPNLDKYYITVVESCFPDSYNVQEKIYFPIKYHHILSKSLDFFDNVPRKIDDISTGISMTFYEFSNSKLKSFMEFFSTSPSKWELEYMNMIRTIIEKGTSYKSRNGEIVSYFGYQLRHDLSEGFPITTIKKCFIRPIFEELMWMIRGETDVNILKRKNVHIWDKNSTLEFLKSRNLDYEEGDIGPGYGFQMRHFGAKYVDCHTNYSNQGVDQLSECIRLIKNEPNSRRIMINLWNPVDLDKMALPPCHFVYNFSVENSDLPSKKSRLNCHLIQRSWDVLLGWNTSTAALLTHLLAKTCDLEPGIIVHSITDAHIYQSHLSSGGVDCLLERKPRGLPVLNIRDKKDITEYNFDDITLKNYFPCPHIKFDMVA